MASPVADSSSAPGTTLKPRTFLRIPIAVLMPIVLLFGGAGRLGWTAGWVYMALLGSGMLAAIVVFVKLQPGLAQQRMAHWREGKRWDRPFLLIIGVLGPAAVQLVCGLDERFGWSATVPFDAQVLAAIVFECGVALTTWAMAVNPFFEATVRIQTDRGHTVVASGPYRYLRHPGYSGMLLATVAGPVVMGTLAGLIPVALLVCAFVWRTALEDRTLRAELPGYADYSARVRFRLVPALW